MASGEKHFFDRKLSEASLTNKDFKNMTKVKTTKKLLVKKRLVIVIWSCN